MLTATIHSNPLVRRKYQQPRRIANGKSVLVCGTSKWNVISKVVSQSTIHVLQKNKTKDLPSISEFKSSISARLDKQANTEILVVNGMIPLLIGFFPAFKTDSLSQTYTWHKCKTAACCEKSYESSGGIPQALGQFEMVGQDLVLAGSDGLPTQVKALHSDDSGKTIPKKISSS